MSWHRDRTGLWCPCFQAYQPDKGKGCPAYGCPENTQLSARFGAVGIPQGKQP